MVQESSLTWWDWAQIVLWTAIMWFTAPISLYIVGWLALCWYFGEFKRAREAMKLRMAFKRGRIDRKDIWPND